MACRPSRRRIRIAVLGTVVAICAGIVPRPAFAIKQFFDQFKAIYVKADSTDPKEKAFAAAVETAKCNVCHEGKSKKDRNAYGQALAELLDKKEDKENVEKIKKSLETVAAESPTFGDRIKEGKLPVDSAP
ncbi:MAG: hypothetical protein NT089_10990 [Planctomycetia bacterium]|nr:hypothetical protein [Planctomycetia bacterium]